MDHDKKLAFIHKMTKLGLDSIPHYDGGGSVATPIGSNTQLGGPTSQGGFLGIGATNIQAGTNAGQLNQAYNQAQAGLGQEQQLASTLGAQAPGAVSAEQALSQQLQAMTQGQGPNPALAQLNQTTGQNVQNQAALMAGQRGASANPALIARQAAQQGAATQQQAAGQAATMEAQQQIAAQQNLANLSANQVNQAGQGVSAYNQAAQNEQGQLLQANAAGNTASQNATNSGINLGLGVLGGIFGGGSAVASGGTSAAHGGIIQMAEGGIAPQSGSFVGNYLNAPIQTGQVTPVDASGFEKNAQSAHQLGMAIKKKTDVNAPPPSPLSMAEGGKVPAMVSAKERFLTPKDVKKVMAGADPMKLGREFKGKAKVKDDSLKNDTIKTTLEEGGIVIPRHITTHPMASERAAAFVRHCEAKKGRLH